MPASKSNENLQYILQMECLKFDISVPLERRAVVAFLLDNEHRVGHNWLIEKVKAARMKNYERFYEELPVNIKLVYETNSSNDAINWGNSRGQYKGWGGSVCKYNYAIFMRCETVEMKMRSLSPASALTSDWDRISSEVVREKSRFPSGDEHFINVSTGAAAEFIQHIAGAFSNPTDHTITIHSAIRGLRRILTFASSTNAHIYGIFTRSTFEEEYNLEWVQAPSP